METGRGLEKESSYGSKGQLLFLPCRVAGRISTRAAPGGCKRRLYLTHRWSLRSPEGASKDSRSGLTRKEYEHQASGHSSYQSPRLQGGM